MSISRFQEKVLTPGCLTGLGIACAIVFMFSGYMSCGQKGAAPAPTATSESVATIGDVPVPLAEIQQATDQAQSRMQQQNPNGASAVNDAAALQEGLMATMHNAAIQALAKRSGVDISDDAVRAVYSKMIEQRIDMMRMFSGVKPGASQKEVDDALKTQLGGKTPDQYKADALDDLNKALGDSSRHQLVVDSFTEPVYLEAMASKMQPSDDEVRHSYDSYTVKQILINDKPSPAQNVQARADKALADLKSGLSFEDAMNRYSDELPSGGSKKVSDNVVNLSGQQVQTQDMYKPIASLKPGQTTGAIPTPTGVVIYKLTGITSKLPKDFDAQKAKYKRQYAEDAARDQVQKQVNDLLAGPDVKWKDKGFQALYEYASLSQDMSHPLAPADRVAKVKEIAELAKNDLNASNAAGEDQRAAAMAYYAATDELYNAPNADKTALLDQRIDSINRMLATTEDIGMRIELVKLYAEKKDAADASQNLLMAAQNNNDPTVAGEAHFHDIQGQLMALQAQHLIDQKTVDAIGKEQARWRNDKAQADQAKAEQDAEMKKEQEEAAKQAAEEAKKQKAGGKAPAGQPGASSGLSVAPSAPGGAVAPATGSAAPGGAASGAPAAPPAASSAPAAGGKGK